MNTIALAIACIALGFVALGFAVVRAVRDFRKRRVERYAAIIRKQSAAAQHAE